GGVGGLRRWGRGGVEAYYPGGSHESARRPSTVQRSRRRRGAGRPPRSPGTHTLARRGRGRRVALRDRPRVSPRPVPVLAGAVRLAPAPGAARRPSPVHGRGPRPRWPFFPPARGWARPPAPPALPPVGRRAVGSPPVH